MLRRMSGKTSLVIPLLATLGCGALQQGLNNLSDSALAADSAEAASQTAALAAVALDPTAGAASEAEAAKKAQAAARATFGNNPCVTATVDAAQASRVVYTLDACTGPFGLVKTSGKLTATFTKSGSQFGVALASVDALTINGAKLSLAATVVQTGPQSPKVVTVTSTSTATGQLGRSITHAGNFSAAWDAAGCLTVNGTFSTVDNGVTSSTTLADVRRCMSACPAGGTATLTAITLGGARTIQVTYNGTRTPGVTVTTATGQQTGSILLLCGG